MRLSGAAVPEVLVFSDFSLAFSLSVLLLCAPVCQASPTPATTTTLSVTPGGSVTQGTTLTLQATVLAGASAVSTGSVTFYDGVTVLSAVQLVNAVASTYTAGHRQSEAAPGTWQSRDQGRVWRRELLSEQHIFHSDHHGDGLVRGRDQHGNHFQRQRR